MWTIFSHSGRPRKTKIVSGPEDKPWKLRELMAADLDGNLIRVFYDSRGKRASRKVGKVSELGEQSRSHKLVNAQTGFITPSPLTRSTSTSRRPYAPSGLFWLVPPSLR